MRQSLPRPPRSPAPPRPLARLARRARRRGATWLAAVTAAAAGLVAGGCASEVRVSPDDRAQLADGARLADSLAAAPRWDDAGVVALGYLERLRLGLGSPFRLAEQAAADPRLSGPAGPAGALGKRTAWALLAATYRGEAFAIDSAALGSAPGVTAGVADGGWHRTLIDSAVGAARTPRTGEEAVRVAYALARAEGLVTPRVAQAAVHAAALARDRLLAQQDARRLLDAARADRAANPARDALLLLGDWRVSRRFHVEAPLLSDALAPEYAESVQLAEVLLGQIRREGEAAAWRVLAERAARDSAGAVLAAASAPDAEPSLPRDSTTPAPIGTSPVLPPAVAPVPNPRPVVAVEATPAARRDEPALGALPAAAARRLAALPSAREAYPSAPVVVTLGGYRHVVPADTLPALDSTVQLVRARARLIARARTEELLAAEWGALRETLPAGSAARRELAALVQAAAVAVRPWAQAPAVGVAAGVPTSRPGAAAEVDAVRARDGYRTLEFDPQMPPAWRAAAARQLGDAVADLRGVAAFSLDGLRVRVGENPRRDLALALHEPATRTVYLPPATGAGTVAHELAHDLDWQAARGLAAGRRAPVRNARIGGGGYRTDQLARADSGELAAAVRGLGGARAASRRSLGAAAPGAAPVDADRPAERLARSADFFVAAALARDGRANGVLSAVQDRVLTGYAGVVPPEPGDGAAESLVDVLDTMTSVTPAARAWYLARFGAAGVRSPLAVAGFALGAVPAWEGERVLRFAGVPGGLAGPENPGYRGTCGIGGGAPAAWQTRLVWLAADARARGFVRARAAHAAAAGGAFWGWTARSTLGGPWREEPAELSVARVRDGVLRAALGEARRAAGLCATTASATR